jgi:hypothetical protein
MSEELAAIIRAISHLPEVARVEMLKETLRLGQVAAGELSRSVRSKLALDPTGRLARSFLVTAEDKGGVVSSTAASGLAYAAIQDQGGTIRAKSKKLAIPIRGKPGAPRRGQGPRDFGRPLFFIPSMGGRAPLLAEHVGKRRKVVPRYVLKTSVRINGTHYLEDASNRFIEETNKTAELMGAGLQLMAIGVGNG